MRPLVLQPFLPLHILLCKQSNTFESLGSVRHLSRETAILKLRIRDLREIFRHSARNFNLFVSQKVRCIQRSMLKCAPLKIRISACQYQTVAYTSHTKSNGKFKYFMQMMISHLLEEYCSCHNSSLITADINAQHLRRDLVNKSMESIKKHEFIRQPQPRKKFYWRVKKN